MKEGDLHHRLDRHNDRKGMADHLRRLFKPDRRRGVFGRRAT